MTTLSIGRSSHCDVVLADPTVSRRHAEVTDLGHGAFLFVDLGSTSGSFVRDGDLWQPLGRATLAGEDLVRVGDVEARLWDLVRAKRGSAPPPIVERDPATGQIVVRPR